MSPLPRTHRDEFPTPGLKKTKQVKAVERPDITEMSVVAKGISFNDKYLGRLYGVTREFRSFLDKFGRRMKLDDWLDNWLFDRDDRRWVIRYDVLLAGYRLWKQNQEAFAEAVETAATGDDFLAISGVG